MATMTAAEPLDPAYAPAGGDVERLNELGYEQELKHGKGIFDSVAMGFATISPVVGAITLIRLVYLRVAWPDAR